MSNMDQLVATYVALRDKKAEVAERHKQELAPINEGLAKLEQRLHERLTEMGLDSAKTPNGTAYKTTWTKASVSDMAALTDYVAEHGRFDLFTRAVSKEVALEIGNVPGVEITTGVKVNIRRS